MSATISLLHPPGQSPPAAGGRAAPNETDLGLGPIVRALDIDGRHSRAVRAVLSELNADPQVIRYRQDILDDLLRLPALAGAFEAALPRLETLAGAGRERGWGDPIPLAQVANRLAELDVYVTCVEALWAALDAAGSALRSAGLTALRAALAAAREEPDYRRLAAELPALRARLDQAGSVTVGINLDAQLQPESATIVAINQGRFAGKGTLFERLFGERAAPDAVRGSSALYKADERQPHTPEHELFRELSRLLERIVAPIAAAVSSYVRLNSAWLAALEPELAFYLGGARLANDLRGAGMALCRPEIAPATERACTIRGIYSLDLALRLRATPGIGDLRNAIVPNDVAFGPRARIFILTGPNSGGKTTYTRAVGQAQVLFQAGLLTPGTYARISPVDGIFTHFVVPERLDGSGGRLVEELERLGQIFRSASRCSLVLLNEPLASTDHASARALSHDLLAGLRLLGARTIYVTHLHELAAEATAPDTGVVSLVAGVAAPAGNGAEPRPTYVIAPGQPQTPGYAVALARQHGLSRAQIAQTLRARGVVPEDEP